MSINNGYSNISNAMWRLKNPNSELGTVLIELPADVGRAYSGYKRGGVIEASEKFRKEVMSAAVWLFGIPVFNKVGNFACEKLLKIPMDIDYSNAKDGADAIKNSIEYLAGKTDGKGFDVSDLKKYVGKFNIKDVDKTVKKIKGAKQAISISAWILNCILMGIVLPKLNQKITSKKLNENNNKNEKTLDIPTFEQYANQTKKDNLSFKGITNLNSLSNIADAFTYGINTNNTCRLVSTDVPMIIGRCATARNKYEALEIGLMDTAAIYFYNFCLGHSEKLLRKICPTPNINPRVAEYVANIDKNTIEEAIAKIKNNTKQTTLDLFGEKAQKEIYKQATFGKYGKINRFVKDSELEAIDETLVKLLEHIDSKNIRKNGIIDKESLKKLIKGINIKNAAFHTVGTIASVIGLGILIPKVAYGITKLVTGKDGFIGIEKEESKK